MSLSEKYDGLADGFSQREYAEPERYARRRAEIFIELGPRLRPGATVVDLGCGDGISAGPLLEHGLRYIGVDASPRMIEVAGRAHPGIELVVALQEEYEPAEPVDATLCLRFLYLLDDRVSFLRRIAGYTRVKVVFDFRQSEHSIARTRDECRAAGFSRIEFRAFFTPQRHALPGVAHRLLELLERTGPLALLLSKRFGRVFCSAGF